MSATFFGEIDIQFLLWLAIQLSGPPSQLFYDRRTTGLQLRIMQYMSQISKAISIKITCKEIDSVVDSFPLTLNEDLYNFHVLTFVYQMVFFCLYAVVYCMFYSVAETLASPI